jgi:tRNA-dihydrouridine synthase
VSLRLVGRSVTRVIDPPTLLAPMDGVTDASFRLLVAQLGGLGAAVTEFVRITTAPVPQRICRRDLGPAHGIPVAIQFMTPGTEHLAASVQHAEAAGAAWIDLNFGCPAPVVFNKCAGSALLDHPDRLAAIVRTAAAATGLPVTAKLRAGIRDPGRLHELMHAVAEAGAAAVTLHARLRCQGYGEPATWAWIAAARAALPAAIPLIGNGGVATPADIGRMRAATGCDAVMVGCGALADPFVFRTAAGGEPPTPTEAAAFAVAYLDAIGGGGPKAKQFTRWYRAGGLLDDTTRRTLLAGDASAIRPWFAYRANGSSIQNRVTPSPLA